jgi:hypothetical protein
MEGAPNAAKLGEEPTIGSGGEAKESEDHPLTEVEDQKTCPPTINDSAEATTVGETSKQVNPRRRRRRGIIASRSTSTTIYCPSTEEPGTPSHSVAPRDARGEGAGGSMKGRRDHPQLPPATVEGEKKNALEIVPSALTQPGHVYALTKPWRATDTNTQDNRFPSS